MAGWAAFVQARRDRARVFPRMLFTPAGFMLLVVAIAVAFDMVSSPSPVKRLLTGVLLGALVVDVVWLLRQVRHLGLVQAWSSRTRAGEPAELGVRLTNRSAGDALVRVRLEGPEHPVLWGWVPRRQARTFASVRSGQRLPRGVHAFPRFSLTAHSPLRLFLARWTPPSNPDDPSELLVWPAAWTGAMPPWPTAGDRPNPLPEASPLTSSHDPREGQRALGTPGSQGWLREWRQGDRLAHIAHKASAHRDQLLVQTASAQTDDARPDVKLTIAWARSHAPQSEEAALALLGTAAEQALFQGRRVGLNLDEAHVAPGSGETQRRRILDALARASVGVTP